MKKILFVCLSLALIFTVTSPASASYVETFDSGTASFNYGYGTSFTLGTTNYANLGGNPGGYIYGTSSNLYAVWTYVTAPYGDMTGQTMTVDLKKTDSETGLVQFYVGRGGSYYVGPASSISGDSNWTTYTAALNSSNFSVWTGKNSGTYDLAQILQAPDDIGIFFGGNVVSGSGQLEVDNFGTVPIPGSLWLLASGLIALVGIRRRKNPAATA